MELSNEQLDQIEDYIRGHCDACLSSTNPVLLIHPATNEHQWITSDIDYVIPDYLADGYENHGHWNDLGK